MLRYFISLFLAFFALVVLQYGLFASLFPAMLVPDLLVIIVAYLALQNLDTPTLWLIFLGGLLVDIQQAVALGPHAAALLFVALLLFSLSQHIYASSGLVFALVVFVSTILHAVASLVVFRGSSFLLHLHWSQLLVQAVVSAILSLPFVLIVNTLGFFKKGEKRGKIGSTF